MKRYIKSGPALGRTFIVSKSYIIVTDKAIGIPVCPKRFVNEYNRKIVWFPKSQLKIEELPAQLAVKVTIPQWLLDKNLGTSRAILELY